MILPVGIPPISSDHTTNLRHPTFWITVEYLMVMGKSVQLCQKTWLKNFVLNASHPESQLLHRHIDLKGLEPQYQQDWGYRNNQSLN